MKKSGFAVWSMGVVAVLALALMGCKGGESARLRGTVQSVKDSTLVVLSKIDQSTQGASAVLDSAKVLGGTFTLKGTNYPDGLYSLQVEDRSPFMVYVGGSSVPEVSIPADEDQAPPVFSKGLYDATLTAFYAHVSEFSQRSSKLEAEFVELQKSVEGLAPAEAEKRQQEIQPRQEELRDEYMKASEELEANIFAVVQDHKNDPVALHILWLGMSGSQSDESVARAAELLEGWDSAFEDFDDMKKLRDRIATLDKLSVGKPFTDFSVNDAKGNAKRLSEVAGKGHPVLVEFWASWCRACRGSNPGLVKVYNEFKSSNFDIFAVSLDRDASDWQKAVEADGLLWSQYIMSADAKPTPADLYAVEAIPFNVLLDGEGKIVAKSLSEDELRAKLREMLPAK